MTGHKLSCLGLVRTLTIKGWTALELLLEKEQKQVPDIKMKKNLPKREGFRLEDYSGNPGE